MKNLAPIVLFVYKRFEHLNKTISSLKKNIESKNSQLIIFSDGYKNQEEKEDIKKIRKFIKNIKGFKKIEIYERKKNLGLAKNIVSGANKVFKKYKTAIFLEDDIVVSKNFLNYMNFYLNEYKTNKMVASIHGYCYPINFKNNFKNFFFIRGADCWGWATWRRAWANYENNASTLINKIRKKNLQKDFDFNYSYPYFDMLKLTDKKNHSWAIKWYASAFLKGMYTLYPKRSLVRNIGNDGSGTNSERINKFAIKKQNSIKKYAKVEVYEDLYARNKFEEFFKNIYQKKSLSKKIIEIFKI